MKAVLYEAFSEPPRLTNVNDPTPEPHGVVVQVQATGVCRSDWHGWVGHDADIVLLSNVLHDWDFPEVRALLEKSARSLRSGDLLIIHGSVDDVVVPQHSMSFLKACIDHDVQVDFFTYPMHPHNVRGKDRFHLMEKVLNYVDEKLK